MTERKNLGLGLLALIIVLILSGCNTPAPAPTPTPTPKPVYKIGIVQLAEHPALDAATQGFKDALTEKLPDQVVFDLQNAQGEQTNSTTIVNKFVNDKVSLIMANATNAVKAAREATSTIPIVGTSVTDYVKSGLVASNEAPGGNVTGASDNNPVGVQVELLKALVPNAKVVGIVYSSAEENSEIQAVEAKAALEAKGYEVKIYTVADSNEIQTVVTKACTEVDAFYEPSDNLIASNVPTMANITTAAGIPVITAESSMCEAGFLATYSISYYDLGHKAGEMAFEILVNGANPAKTPIFTFDTTNLTLFINKEVATALGIKIPEGLIK
jgi:putative ABC transport system substrate-binding protein